jgi:hypothetical protein
LPWWPTRCQRAGIRMEDINATLRTALGQVRRIIEKLLAGHGN